MDIIEKDLQWNFERFCPQVWKREASVFSIFKPLGEIDDT